MAVVIDYQDVLGKLYDKSYGGRITPKQAKMLEKLITWDNQLENMIDGLEEYEIYNDIPDFENLEELQQYIKNLKGDMRIE